jgi:hypothetical protein
MERVPDGLYAKTVEFSSIIGEWWMGKWTQEILTSGAIKRGDILRAVGICPLADPEPLTICVDTSKRGAGIRTGGGVCGKVG